VRAGDGELTPDRLEAARHEVLAEGRAVHRSARS